MQNVQHIMIIIIIISISNVPICVAVGGHFILVPFWSHHVTAGICRDLQQFIDVPLKKLVQPGLKNPSLHGDQKPGTQMYPKTAGTGWYWMVLDGTGCLIPKIYQHLVIIWWKNSKAFFPNPNPSMASTCRKQKKPRCQVRRCAVPWAWRSLWIEATASLCSGLSPASRGADPVGKRVVGYEWMPMMRCSMDSP